MSATGKHTAEPIAANEQQARAVAEAARETQWAHHSFVRELYNGKLRLDLVHPYPLEDPEEDAKAQPFLQRLAHVLESIDTDQIEREHKIPQRVIEQFKEIGAFGIKIPQQYGGLGLSLRSYVKAMGMVNSVDASLTTLLAAHQSIGVPQPLLHFGTEEQKQKYLPRLARGAVSAFALTEPDAGSDPSNIRSHAELTDEGDAYVLNGEKLWITNGSIAELLVVMAMTGPQRITAFIVETDWPGVEVAQRCQFMGLNGAEIAHFRFTNVRVPKENLLWKEGAGLKLALVTLNTGRLGLPMIAAFAAKRTLSYTRVWANRRVQWGRVIGKHDLIAQIIGNMAASTFALESVAELTAILAQKENVDIRLEAAIAKLYNTEMAGHIIDDAVQVYGGRGYETRASIHARGENSPPLERMYRDARILRIFEGTSEIMHLFIAREVVDMHLSVAGDLINQKLSLLEKIKPLLTAGAYYSLWYPKLWLGWGYWPRYSEFGRLAPQMRYLSRTTRRLARALFHAIVIFGARLEKRQSVLARLIDIGAELYAMTASCVRAQAMLHAQPDNDEPVEIAVLFCRQSRRRVERLFKTIFNNDDTQNYKLARDVLAGKHTWLEQDLPHLVEEKDAGRSIANGVID